MPVIHNRDFPFGVEIPAAVDGLSEDCDCGGCRYVQPDCCGEPRPRCETGSAHDFYICSVGRGCDVTRHLLGEDGLTVCGIAVPTLTPRTVTTFYAAVTCPACR